MFPASAALPGGRAGAVAAAAAAVVPFHREVEVSPGKRHTVLFSRAQAAWLTHPDVENALRNALATHPLQPRDASKRGNRFTFDAPVGQGAGAGLHLHGVARGALVCVVLIGTCTHAPDAMPHSCVQVLQWPTVLQVSGYAWVAELLFQRIARTTTPEEQAAICGVPGVWPLLPSSISQELQSAVAAMIAREMLSPVGFTADELARLHAYRQLDKHNDCHNYLLAHVPLSLQVSTREIAAAAVPCSWDASLWSGGSAREGTRGTTRRREDGDDSEAKSSDPTGAESDAQSDGASRRADVVSGAANVQLQSSSESGSAARRAARARLLEVAHRFAQEAVAEELEQLADDEDDDEDEETRGVQEEEEVALQDCDQRQLPAVHPDARHVRHGRHPVRAPGGYVFVCSGSELDYRRLCRYSRSATARDPRSLPVPSQRSFRYQIGFTRFPLSRYRNYRTHNYNAKFIFLKKVGDCQQVDRLLRGALEPFGVRHTRKWFRLQRGLTRATLLQQAAALCGQFPFYDVSDAHLSGLEYGYPDLSDLDSDDSMSLAGGSSVASAESAESDRLGLGLGLGLGGEGPLATGHSFCSRLRALVPPRRVVDAGTGTGSDCLFCCVALLHANDASLFQRYRDICADWLLAHPDAPLSVWQKSELEGNILNDESGGRIRTLDAYAAHIRGRGYGGVDVELQILASHLQLDFHVMHTEWQHMPDQRIESVRRPSLGQPPLPLHYLASVAGGRGHFQALLPVVHVAALPAAPTLLSAAEAGPDPESDARLPSAVAINIGSAAASSVMARPPAGAARPPLPSSVAQNSDAQSNVQQPKRRRY